MSSMAEGRLPTVSQLPDYRERDARIAWRSFGRGGGRRADPRPSPPAAYLTGISSADVSNGGIVGRGQLRRPAANGGIGGTAATTRLVRA